MADPKELPIYDNPGHLARRLHQIAGSIFLSGTPEFGNHPGAVLGAYCRPPVAPQRRPLTTGQDFITDT